MSKLAKGICDYPIPLDMDTLKNIVATMRPRQYIKNLAVFIALLVSHHLFDFSQIVLVIASYIIFCMLSSSTYFINDILDQEKDKYHPQKSSRPIASGRLNRATATLSAVVLGATAIFGGAFINLSFMMAVVVYLGIQISYATFLKRVVVIDVFCIAAGFYLRVIAGALAIDVTISPWLLACIFFIALFPALSKRRWEVLVLGPDRAGLHRDVLSKYTILSLDRMIKVAISIGFILYVIYVVSEEHSIRLTIPNLTYTIPVVIYGIYRYLHLVYRKGEGGSPEEIFLTDKPILITIAVYTLTVIGILYLR